MVYVYAALAVGLLFIELHTTSFYAMFIAIGAIGAAVVAWLSPSAVPAQVATAIALSVLGVVLFRPFAARLYRRTERGPVGIGVHGGLVGQRAVALDVIGKTGHVLLRGESWLAASQDGGVIEPNDDVVITRVQGTTLLVRPVSHP